MKILRQASRSTKSLHIMKHTQKYKLNPYKSKPNKFSKLGLFCDSDSHLLCSQEITQIEALYSLFHETIFLQVLVSLIIDSVHNQVFC